LPPSATDYERIAKLLVAVEFAERPLARMGFRTTEGSPIHVLNAWTASSEAVRVLERLRAETSFQAFSARLRIDSWLRAAADGSVLWTSVVGRARANSSLLNPAFSP